MAITEQDVQSALKQLIDPNTKTDYVTSKSAKNIKIDGNNVSVDVLLGYPAKSQLEPIRKEIFAKLKTLPGVGNVNVNVTMKIVSHAVQRGVKLVPGIKNIIAVASGKGGVGKSTTAVNLALALAAEGATVGVLDADIYGPSQPRLTDTEGKRPVAEGQKLVAVDTPFGVPLLSMGHLVKPGQAIAWRGPMAGNALGQLIDAEWGDANVLIADMPPGTGDVQLSMVQKHKPIGAVIVSTPQDLALIDATRAIDLFRTSDVPIIGIIENMSGYACPHCGEISDPFGSGGAEAAAKEMGVPFLGRIPLAMDIRAASDAGQPPAAGNGPHAGAFMSIAEQLAAWIRTHGG